MEFSKSERRHLRDLVGALYELEAHRELTKLDAEFQTWRQGDLPSSELIDAIHDFHQHAARELWSLYQNPDIGMMVARGIAMGLMELKKIPEPLREKLRPVVDFLKSDTD